MAMNGAAARRAEFPRDDIIKDRFEVVEEDSVGSALKDEGEAPVGIDPGRSGYPRRIHAHIGEQEPNRYKHAQ